MKLRQFYYLTLLSLVGSLGLLFMACGGGSQQSNNTSTATNPEQKGGKIKIGLLLETLKEERWLRDRDLFVKRAQELGAEVEIQVAEGNDAVQLQQAENLLTKGVDVLVVVPHNGVAAASIVNAAKRQNVPVIAYDRLIMNSDVDLYLSFDNVRVGEMQAKYALERAPKGNYVLILGSPTDNNAKLLREGQMNALQPAIDRGDIKIVMEQWANNWQASEALKHIENVLTQFNNDIVAVVASADSVSRGVVQALEANGLSGKVIVTGQDCDIVACQHIAQGKQTMSIYKPIQPLAFAAAEAAVKLAKKEKVEAPQKINNGKVDVSSILLDPIVVDKNNMETTIIKDGYQKKEEIFKNAAAAN